MPTLDWLNRDAAFALARRTPTRILTQVSTHSRDNILATQEDIQGVLPIHEAIQATVQGAGGAGQPPGRPRLAPTRDNLLIQGDNLEALKALLPFYRGQVKCIFIDPPYNTQSAFEHYDDNLEHAQWLSMMLPRLQLLRELLREDGSIWVTIDDNEGHYLKVLMDEVFGRGNFVANGIWQKVYSVRMDATGFSADHDHLMVYSKSHSFSVEKIRADQDIRQFSNIDSTTGNRYRKRSLRKEGSNSKRIDRPNLWYSIQSPEGSDIWPIKPDGTEGYWRWSQSTLTENYHLLEFSKGARGWEVFVKQFLESEAFRPPSTVWSNDEVGHTHEAKEEAKSLASTAAFSTPKPERLIQRILHIASHEGDLILDSFLGSGTTVAVAQKMGRRWIGIEMGEHARTHCLPRLQKVIDGEQGGISKAVDWQGGGSFRFATLGATIFDAQGRIHPEVRFADLAAFIWMTETGRAYEPERLREQLRTQAPALIATPYLGEDTVNRDNNYSQSIAYYLLYNGILKDKRPESGNVLTREVLAALLALHAQSPAPHGALVVYGEACRISRAVLAAANVTFKHIPYDVKAR